MYKILIDTSRREHRVVTLVKVTDVKEVRIDSTEGDIDVVTEIKNILLRNKLDIHNIDEAVPNLGPGSFTGLKMGVTVANIINWAVGKKPINELSLPEYGGEPNIQKKW